MSVNLAGLQGKDLIKALEQVDQYNVRSAVVEAGLRNSQFTLVVYEDLSVRINGVWRETLLAAAAPVGSNLYKKLQALINEQTAKMNPIPKPGLATLRGQDFLDALEGMEDNQRFAAVKFGLDRSLFEVLVYEDGNVYINGVVHPTFYDAVAPSNKFPHQRKAIVQQILSIMDQQLANGIKPLRKGSKPVPKPKEDIVLFGALDTSNNSAGPGAGMVAAVLGPERKRLAGEVDQKLLHEKVIVPVLNSLVQNKLLDSDLAKNQQIINLVFKMMAAAAKTGIFNLENFNPEQVISFGEFKEIMEAHREWGDGYFSSEELHTLFRLVTYAASYSKNEIYQMKMDFRVLALAAISFGDFMTQGDDIPLCMLSNVLKETFLDNPNIEATWFPPTQLHSFFRSDTKPCVPLFCLFSGFHKEGQSRNLFLLDYKQFERDGYVKPEPLLKFESSTAILHEISTERQERYLSPRDTGPALLKSGAKFRKNPLALSVVQLNNNQKFYLDRLKARKEKLLQQKTW